MATFVIYLCFERKGIKTFQRNNFVFSFSATLITSYIDTDQFLKVLKISDLSSENLLYIRDATCSRA